MRPFWCWRAWLFICGTHYPCRCSNVEPLAQQGRLLCRWVRSLRKLDFGQCDENGVRQAVSNIDRRCLLMEPGHPRPVSTLLLHYSRTAVVVSLPSQTPEQKPTKYD